MRISELAKIAELAILTHAERAETTNVARVHSANRISDLLGFAGPATLLLTELSNRHLVQVAVLTESPALCLTGGVALSAELLAAATERGLVLLSTSEPLARATERVYRALHSQDEA